MANKKQATKAKGKGKTVELVTLSEIARRHNVTRQSALNWASTHDTFPDPVIADSAVLMLKIGNDVIKYQVNDPHGKTLYYDAEEVETWKASGVLRERGAAKPKPAPKKKAATAKKAPAKKTVAKKTVKKTEPKTTAKKSSAKKKPATVSKKAAVKKGGKKTGTKGATAANMKREAKARKRS
jgi:hypothetical protein